MTLKILKYALPKILLICAAVPFAVLAAGNLRTGTGKEGARQLEDAVRRASASYYAEEGVYAPGLTPLVEKYALRIDASRYEVKYDPLAENLAPDITVVEILRKEGT